MASSSRLERTISSIICRQVRETLQRIGQGLVVELAIVGLSWSCRQPVLGRFTAYDFAFMTDPPSESVGQRGAIARRKA